MAKSKNKNKNKDNTNIKIRNWLILIGSIIGISLAVAGIVILLFKVL